MLIDIIGLMSVDYTVTTHLPKSAYDDLNNICKEAGYARSKLIRNLIIEYLKKDYRSTYYQLLKEGREDKDYYV